MKGRREIEAFVTGQPVPRLFGPDWVQYDLTDTRA